METTTQVQYSNPRTEAVILDWPYGKHRTTARFFVESHPKRGERTGGETVNPKTGRLNKAKYTTYSKMQRIVDGDDGRTYIAEFAAAYGMIQIRQSNLQYEQETAHAGHERFNELLELFA